MTKCFSKMALSSSERALNLLNRDACSSSFGCFDRAYWHFKTKDFPSASFQMGVEFLARLWALKDSPFHKNPQLLSWIKASMAYSLRIQHKDGSFDEWYPNERGWAGPTAYVLHSLIQAFEITFRHLPEDFKHQMQESFLSAGRFLLKQKEGADLANHYALFLLTVCEVSQQVPHFKQEFDFDTCLKGFKNLVSKEGWSKEYDGPDFSYNLATLSFLARLDKIHPHPYIRGYAKESLLFLSHFIYPDGSFGGLGSRETIHLYPLALKYWGQSFKIAQVIDNHLQTCGSYEKLKPSDQDDHYLFYRLNEYMETDTEGTNKKLDENIKSHSDNEYMETDKEGTNKKLDENIKSHSDNEYMETDKEGTNKKLDENIKSQSDNEYMETDTEKHKWPNPFESSLKTTESVLPCLTEKNFKKYFPQAGLFVVKNLWFYLAVNLKRGGALRLYNTANGQCILKNTGWVFERKNKSLLTNALFVETNKITVNEGELMVEGNAMFYNSKYFKPLSFVAFRLTVWFAKHYQLAFLMKKIIRKLLILRKKKSKHRFKRVISWGKGQWHIKDIIHCSGVKKLYYGGHFSLRYVPQSNYFEMSDLKTGPVIFKPEKHKKGFIVKQSCHFEKDHTIRQNVILKTLD